MEKVSSVRQITLQEKKEDERENITLRARGTLRKKALCWREIDV